MTLYMHRLDIVTLALLQSSFSAGRSLLRYPPVQPGQGITPYHSPPPQMSIPLPCPAGYVLSSGAGPRYWLHDLHHCMALHLIIRKSPGPIWCVKADQKFNLSIDTHLNDRLIAPALPGEVVSSRTFSVLLFSWTFCLIALLYEHLAVDPVGQSSSVTAPTFRLQKTPPRPCRPFERHRCFTSPSW